MYQALGIALLVFWHAAAVAGIVLGIVVVRRTGALRRQTDTLAAEVVGLRVQVSTLIGTVKGLARELGWDDDLAKTRELSAESFTRERRRHR